MHDLVKIIRYSWSLRRYYISTAVLVVILAVLNQATPLLLKWIVDGIVAHKTFDLIFWFLIAILAINILTTVLTNVQGLIGDMLGVKLHSLLSQRYYDHLLKLPLEYFDNEITGRITSRLERGITTISQLVQMLANNFIGFFLTSFFTLAILAHYSWPVALMLALLFPSYIWLTTLSSKAWQKHQDGINKDTDQSQGRFIESIGQIRVVKSFAQEAAESRFFGGRRGSIEKQTWVQSKQWHWYDVVRRSILGTILAGTYGLIVWQTYRGHFTLGTMVLMLQLVTQAQWPLFGSSFIIEALQRAQAGSKDFFEVMETKPTILDQPGARDLKVTDGRVQYHDLSFSYSGGKAVLNQVSFDVEPGSKLALVGESGEGKTTISNLLLRFYQPSGGRITIDGQDIAEVTQESLRRNIAVVFQEPALFSGTVAENIRYGTPKASKEDMLAAAKAANAEEFIAKLSKGYDTEIGERGVKLSGGQKQRIAIARAILKNAPILILDEATSSLDSKAEREVQEALETLMQGRTTLIIAHRLSTIAGVDLIVGLQGGKVLESGSPEELAQGEGIYAELLALQQPTRANKAKLKKYDIAKV